jgi:hypothetical protein
MKRNHKIAQPNHSSTAHSSDSLPGPSKETA